MKDRNWLARQKWQKKTNLKVLLKGTPVAKFILLGGRGGGGEERKTPKHLVSWFGYYTSDKILAS